MAEPIPAYYTDPSAPRPRGIVPNMIQSGGRTYFVDVSRPSSGRGGSGAEESGRGGTSYAANQGLAGPSAPSVAPSLTSLGVGGPAPSTGGWAPSTGGTAPAAGGMAPAAGGAAPQTGSWAPTIGSIIGGGLGLMAGGPIGMGLGAWGGYEAGKAFGGPQTVQNRSQPMRAGGAVNAGGLFANAMREGVY